VRALGHETDCQLIRSDSIPVAVDVPNGGAPVAAIPVPFSLVIERRKSYANVLQKAV
jgi:hypothetical protein